MTDFLVIVIGVLCLLSLVLWALMSRAKKGRDCALAQVEAQRRDVDDSLSQKLAAFETETVRIRVHYEAEARQARDELARCLEESQRELERLRPLASLANAETEVKHRLADAVGVASALQREAQSIAADAKAAASEVRVEAQRRARELRHQVETLLAQAMKDAGRIVGDAEVRAQQTAGDAYTALREKEGLERAVKAIRNVVDGYGDRYVVPTHSLLDELAADYSHTSAGEALRQARDQSRRMVEHGEAATCDYAEANRRETAIRFVVDAFNGRVDAILTRVKHDNHGTLTQEIQDAFSLVNLNGQAFRNARILPAYLDARLSELRWAVVVHELRLQEREEQRRIQEQIREEEKARREYERAIREAAEEETMLKAAMERARAEIERASAAERAALEAKLAELGARLAVAEAKEQRALSMAQQVRSGNVYVISNVGSFGEGILKVGMTRRRDPHERIRELGDASVPFGFDVHAIIPTPDAPALENEIHKALAELRINKVNSRKEFFRASLERIREIVVQKGLTAAFKMEAVAHEYRQTLAVDRMSPEERERHHLRVPAQNGEIDEPLAGAVPVPE